MNSRIQSLPPAISRQHEPSLDDITIPTSRTAQATSDSFSLILPLGHDHAFAPKCLTTSVYHQPNCFALYCTTYLCLLGIDQDDTAGRHHSLVFRISIPCLFVINRFSVFVHEVGVQRRGRNDDFGEVFLRQWLEGGVERSQVIIVEPMSKVSAPPVS